MRTFLRKIRRSLTESGSVGKYLLYAVGEIFLVVIGILIALKINSWNEWHRERQVEKQIFTNLYNDLKEDTTYLRNRIELSKREYASLKNYIQKSYDKQNRVQEFKSLLNPIEFNVENLVIQDRTYREILNNGKLDFILDESLRNEISDYYRLYELKAAVVKEQNETALTTISNASMVAPNLKYAEWELTEDIFTESNMYDDEEWAYINAPHSKAFKLWEETALYYAFKNQVALDHYLELKDHAIKILQLLNERMAESNGNR